MGPKSVSSGLFRAKASKHIDCWQAMTDFRNGSNSCQSNCAPSASAFSQCAPESRQAAVQILLGHTKIESTVRYLGVDIEDALALSEAQRFSNYLNSSTSKPRSSLSSIPSAVVRPELSAIL